MTRHDDGAASANGGALQMGVPARRHQASCLTPRRSTRESRETLPLSGRVSCGNDNNLFSSLVNAVDDCVVLDEQLTVAAIGIRAGFPLGPL